MRGHCWLKRVGVSLLCFKPMILQGPEAEGEPFPRVPSVWHPLLRICPLKITLNKTTQDMSTDPYRQSFAH